MRLTVLFARLADSLIDGLSSSCFSFLGHFQLEDLLAEGGPNIVNIFSELHSVRIFSRVFFLMKLFEEPFKVDLISSTLRVRIRRHKLCGQLQDFGTAKCGT